MVKAGWTNQVIILVIVVVARYLSHPLPKIHNSYMILESIRIKWISDQKGYGLFASQFIPKGTVIFVSDELDIVLDEASYQAKIKKSPHLASVIEKYCYEDNKSNRIICWDFSKYFNHCCYPNSLSTGYGFEVAIKDIQVGEEITDDYRIFSVGHEISKLDCVKANCLNTFDYNKDHVKNWDENIKAALVLFHQVDQPLRKFIDENTISSLEKFLQNNEDYLSVKKLIPQFKF